MTDTELIALQAKEIAELRLQVCGLEGAIQRAKGQILCIGGPLNDNKRGYTPEQLAEWSRVLVRLEEA